MTVWTGEARLVGAGNASIATRQRQLGRAIFAGSSTLSAIDTLIQFQTSFLCTSFLQAVADSSLADMVGDPKVRLVLAVEIGILPLG
jgi:hypothetical protein